MKQMAPHHEAPLIKFTTSVLGARLSPYSLQDVCSWVDGARGCQHGGRHLTARAFEDAQHGATQGLPAVNPDMLEAMARPWIQTIINWEAHLRTIKQVLWTRNANVSKPAIEGDFQDMARAKVLRRLGFVLASDWSRFPAANPPQRALLQQLRAEQISIRHEINTLVGDTRRVQLMQQNDAAAQSALIADDARMEEVRTRIVDFARRLARVY
eukprot:TRINITY_DN11467_c0_g1_i2.p1 TRINITY_DN11467_c0_g1~~TRINITY_DN11467_c0_g1_i2.p1  ORF type:complete len:212 (-),score=68.37 TRINITY_DN11467_c0_g1_i2:75-710(-)